MLREKLQPGGAENSTL
uniref:Uncharacterized protein n=1 Tax=Arundo donax TaxID=35708 RepID=A0A0A9A467_ARUDO